MCRRTGGNSEEGTPVPIPNTEVKLFSSDDTLGVAPRENKTSPFHPPIWAVFLLLRLSSPALEYSLRIHCIGFNRMRGEKATYVLSISLAPILFAKYKG
jgi:hypothetical protein